MDLVGDLDSYERRDWDDGTVDDTLRMAVIGLGWFGHDMALPSIRTADYAEPTVVVSGSPDVREETAAEYGATAIDYDGYEAGVATDDYDAVYVATPNALHPSHVETAAGLGKHVICEKPLAATVEGAERAVAACEDAGVRLMTAYRLQTDPRIRRVRELVRDGVVGEPRLLHGNFSFRMLADGGDPDQWRLDADLAGGGALPDIGVYPLNTSRFIVDREPTAVSAETCGEGAFADVDRLATLLVSFGDVTGSFTADFDAQADDELTVVGDEGRIRIENAFEPREQRRIGVRRGEHSATIDPAPVDDLREEFDYFAHAVLTDGEIEPDGRDGLSDVRTMVAAYDAAEEGRRVELDG